MPASEFSAALPAPAQSEAAGFILAGGHSSRMGTDKALAEFAGMPLVQNAIEILVAAGLSATIAGSRTNLSQYAAGIQDSFPEAGPLGGIHAALSSSFSEWNLFFPVDMPLMPASLLRLLIDRARLTRARVTATKLNGRLEPFPVVLHRSVLFHLTDRLRSGQSAPYQAWQIIPPLLGSILDAPRVEFLVQSGQCCDPRNLPPVFWYQSANTPGELANLNRLHDLHNRPVHLSGKLNK